MKELELNSMYHYEVVRRGDFCVLIEYADEQCPGMGDRRPFTPDEGRGVAQWDPDEEIELKMVVRYKGMLKPTGGVICGDDIPYEVEKK